FGCSITPNEGACHGTVTNPVGRSRPRCCGPAGDAEHRHPRRVAGGSAERTAHDGAQSDYRGGTAKPGPNRDPELESAAPWPPVGNDGGYRHPPPTRPCPALPP